MGLLTSWMYPVEGVLFLLTTPQLLQLVLRFLGIVTASSFASLVICFSILWHPHLAIIGRLLGINWFTKFLTTVLLIGESAVPIYLIFEHRLDKLGKQLFDRTLQLKLGTAPPPSASSNTFSAAQQQHPAARQASVAPIKPQDAQELTRLVTQHRQAEAAASKRRSLLVAVLGFAVQFLLKPKNKEGIVLRKARDLATLGVTALVPGAALLLPLLVYRDSSVEVSNLMSHYWEAKGIKDDDAHELLAQRHMTELRGFGLVATGLSYIPVLNWALSLSNHVAAALYAAHIEAKGAPLLRTWWL